MLQQTYGKSNKYMNTCNADSGSWRD